MKGIESPSDPMRLLSLLLILLAPHISAQPAVDIVRTPRPPRIDGLLSDDGWTGAAKVENFYQREPNPGSPASEKTEVFILFDDEQIYFGFRCWGDASTVTAKEMARDVSLGQDDRVQVILDTFLDRRSGYWFQIGPRGSIGDALVSDNGATFNKDWDGLWEGKARIFQDRWEAEIAIPFKTLTFRPGLGTWGLKLIRHIKSREESSYWPEGNLNTYNFQVSDSGELRSIDGISQGLGLELKPYGLAGFDHRPDGSTAFRGDAGIDLFYQLTPGVKSALTINTDFAETEVDTRRVNLTRFPLFFPEKRDFFLDGANYFDFAADQELLIPFFSRRLGLDPGGNPVPILWGAKVTGRQGDWNLGILDIMEERQENTGNSFAARITRNFFKQSSVGAILTHGNSLSEAQNTLFGIDLKFASSEFRGNRNIELSLYGLKASTDGLPGRDTAAGIEFRYPNDFLNFGVGFQQIEEHFLAGIGFVPRTDIRNSNLQLTLGPRPGRLGIRQVQFGGRMEYITNLDNLLLTREITFNPLTLRFDSGDTLSGSISSQYELLGEDFKIRPGFTIPAGAYDFIRYGATFQSAQRRNLWAGAATRWGGFFGGTRRSHAASVGYKVAVPLYLEAAYERDLVQLPTGSFTVNVSRLNANILFSPDVTLYSFLQYDNQSRSLGWQSRFYWILKPGNEIILVWNSNWVEPLDRLQLGDGNLRFKINYNFRF